MPRSQPTVKLFGVSGGMLSRDSGLPLDTRNSMGIFRKRFLKAYMLEKDHPQLSSRIHRNCDHLLADWEHLLQEILWNMEEV